MSEFVVSARKYRPQDWSDVVGQKSITDTLNNAINAGKIANAYLFCGPRGVGKTTCARIFAKKINQQDGGSDETFEFNVFELDAASNNSVDDIRNLTDQVRVPPQKGKYKVYIIDEVHMLSTAAFNAFLKTLEEPPAHAKFVLATTEKHKILPTILSRCQIYDFKRIGITDMKDHLASIAEKEGIATDDNGLIAIARKADGALRDALSIFDQVVASSAGQATFESVSENLGILDIDMFFELVDLIDQEKIHEALLIYHDTLRKGFDGHQFLLGIAEHYRNLIMAGNAETIALIETAEDTREKFKEQFSRIDQSRILKALNLIGESESKFRASQNKRLLVELTIMQLCSLKAHQKKKSEPIVIVAPKGIPAKPGTDLSDTSEQAPPTPPRETSTVSSPDPEPAKPKPAEPIKRKAKPTFSIRQSLEKSKAEEPAPSPQQKSPHPSAPIQDAKNQPVSQDALNKMWRIYAETIREAGNMSFYTTLKQREPVLEGTVIHFTVNNVVQQEDLQNYKVEMLEFFRKRLKNFSLSFEWEVMKTDDGNNLYTPTDKFNRLAELNPQLHEFRKRFDLDIDF